MANAHVPIPVFVMSYNDLASLRLCLRALARRTLRPHRLVVVDNASSDPPLRRYLDRLASLTRIEVWRNRVNLWVLGLNRAVRAWSRSGAAEDFFVVTDCDILVPPPKDGQCWLARLEQGLERHACVGKLGLSLDLGYIRTRPHFAHTYARELFFTQGPRIGELVIAPVDTTLAIYRKSMFVTDHPLFIPTHQSLYRPHMYCCRTGPELQAKHLSWRFYERRPQTDVVAKLLCFGLLGATVNPVLLQEAPWHARWLYLITRPMARLCWGGIAAGLIAVFMLRVFPRKFNHLQASRRA